MGLLAKGSVPSLSRLTCCGSARGSFTAFFLSTQGAHSSTALSGCSGENNPDFVLLLRSVNGHGFLVKWGPSCSVVPVLSLRRACGFQPLSLMSLLFRKVLNVFDVLSTCGSLSENVDITKNFLSFSKAYFSSSE